MASMDTNNPTQTTRKLYPLTKRTLWKHQLAAGLWLKDKKTPALFMEMRLGKSLVAIQWCRRQIGPHLIVCPKSVIATWINELNQEGITGRRVIDLTATNTYGNLCGDNEQQKICADGVRFFIVNYERLSIRTHKGDKRGRPSYLCSIPWGTVVLDESIKIKNPKAKITKVCIKHFRHVNHRLILCGLPNPESELDYITQFLFLHDRVQGASSYWNYRATHYYPPEFGSYNWTPKIGTRKELKQFVKANAFTLTREKAGLGNKMLTQLRVCVLPIKARKVYQAIEKEWGYKELTTKFIVVMKGVLAQITGGRPKDDRLKDAKHDAKIDELLYLLETELKHEKVIVWFKYNNELKATLKRLRLAKIKVSTITGKTPNSKRELRRRSLVKGKLRVLLLQIKCAKYGLDLSCCDTQIVFSPTYSYDDHRQSLDRIAHPTKKKPLLTINLVCMDTVDIDVLEAINTKDITANTFNKTLIKAYKRRLKRSKVWEKLPYASTVDKHTRQISVQKHKERKDA